MWQGRFKAFPIEQDAHELTVLRDIECNPVWASIVARAEDWWWSGARRLVEPSRGPRIEAVPAARPEPWLDWVNDSMTETAVQQIRRSVNRGAPFGSAAWATVTASLLGHNVSLRAIGRPRKLVGT